MSQTPRPIPHPPAYHHTWGGHEVPLVATVDARERLDAGGIGAWLDVIGGVSFAILVGMLVSQTGALVFAGVGWGATIGWESVWLFTAMLCAGVMPLGIRHVTTLASTLRGLLLNWPEMLLATLLFIEVVQYELPSGVLGPLGLAISVGAAEEFVFRVLLLGWLVTRLPAEKALVVSAVVFGVAHMQEFSLVGMMSITPQFAGGLLYGAIYLRTRNILGPIIAHAYWDFPIFLGWGLVSGGGTEGGMPSLTSGGFWIYLAIAVYSMWLVRPSVNIAVRDDDPHQLAHPARG